MRKSANKIRIIAGKWKSRQISFPDRLQLRPTPDRVRETLFNWLRDYLPGSRCLDLFAGSGILGIEALSRGAEQVVFVDNHRETLKNIQTTINTLNTGNTEHTNSRFITQDVLSYLSGADSKRDRFDIVFIDPPYSSNCIPEVCEQLANLGWLAENAKIYFERDVEPDLDALPAQWQLIRQKKAGNVYYYLYLYSKQAD